MNPTTPSRRPRMSIRSIAVAATTAAALALPTVASARPAEQVDVGSVGVPVLQTTEPAASPATSRTTDSGAGLDTLAVLALAGGLAGAVPPHRQRRRARHPRGAGAGRRHAGGGRDRRIRRQPRAHAPPGAAPVRPAGVPTRAAGGPIPGAVPAAQADRESFAA